MTQAAMEIMLKNQSQLWKFLKSVMPREKSPEKNLSR